MKSVFFCLALSLAALGARAETIDPDRLVKDAVNYWRGASSYAEATMKIHRPDWERSMGFVGWTQGEDRSLVRFTAPPKDKGNATLVVDREMWSYSPKINRTIKIPPSMMSQSWMGSDFSHSDLSKQKDIVDRYSHTVIGTETSGGKVVYVIEAVPHEDAAVVWGKEILKIRSDLLMMDRAFYDQDMKLIKALHASDFRTSGGKLYARVARMQNAENPAEWTEVIYENLEFDAHIPPGTFSQASLSAH